MKWHPPKGSTAKSINTVVDHIADDGDTVYRVWPAGRPEPPGNPVKWSGSTLRECGYEPEKGDD